MSTTFWCQNNEVALGRTAPLNARKVQHVSRLPTLAALVFGAALFATGSSAIAGTYTFTDLGTLGGTYSWAYSINDAGQIAGSSRTTGNADNRATVWNGTSLTALDSLGGTQSNANGINSSGKVVGSSNLPGDTIERAALWDGAALTTLDSLGGTSSIAYDINSAGVVVGHSYGIGDTVQYATVWNGTAVTPLASLNGAYSRAYAINDKEQIVGFSDFSSSQFNGRSAALWQGGTVTALDPLGGRQAYALGINNAGQVVGQSSIGDQTGSRAVRWNGTTPEALDTLGGLHSGAFAINNSGQIVGYSWISENNIHATLWNGVAVVDLNTFLDTATITSGWVLVEAFSVNDGGQIVGLAGNSLTGQSHAFLLTPIPEPQISALMLSGLGFLVGLSLHRRKGAGAILGWRLSSRTCRIHPATLVARIASTSTDGRVDLEFGPADGCANPSKLSAMAA